MDSVTAKKASASSRRETDDIPTVDTPRARFLKYTHRRPAQLVSASLRKYELLLGSAALAHRSIPQVMKAKWAIPQKLGVQGKLQDKVSEKVNSGANVIASLAAVVVLGHQHHFNVVD